MRRLFRALFGPDSVSPDKGRPEALRRQTLAANARLMLLVSAGYLPFALFQLTNSEPTPFILALIGLAGGGATLALHQQGHFERSAEGQVLATLLIGLILTLADPAIVDFGFAVALMAPIHASLFTRTPAKKRAWAFLVVVVAFGVLGSLGLFALPDKFTAGLAVINPACFAVVALIVAFSGHRLNAAFEVYERAQVNAYKHLIENVQDAVLRFGSAGGVIFATKTTEKLLGSPRYELSGQGIFERLHILDRPQFMTAFAEANQDGKSRTIEVRIRRDDPAQPGQIPVYFWLEMALSPVIDDQAPAERHEVVALLRDVTERHRVDQEMRDARRVAEDASSAKSRFLATMGHELRTPLNAIVGFSEMMISGVTGEMSPAQREYAEIIHQSGHHLLDVVNMLLDMSRIEAGKFELQTEAFEPGGLVEPCFKMVDGLARQRKVRLMSDLPASLPMLTGDERACRQILINLLSNAVKFSNENAAVTVSMRRQGAHLNISVADRGIGMEADAVGRIGEPFFQANEGLNRRYEGTGLGLSIVKGLVDLHQGSLSAVSSPGEGTVVTVLLPLNGPETKKDETARVMPLRPEPVSEPMPQWQDERRRAL